MGTALLLLQPTPSTQRRPLSLRQRQQNIHQPARVLTPYKLQTTVIQLKRPSTFRPTIYCTKTTWTSTVKISPPLSAQRCVYPRNAIRTLGKHWIHVTASSVTSPV